MTLVRQTTGPAASNITGGLVRGYWYRVIALGSTFEFWMGHKVQRSALRRTALEFIGPEFYSLEDIDSVRRTH